MNCLGYTVLSTVFPTELPRLLSALFALFPLSRDSRDSISVFTVICFSPSMPWTRTSRRAVCASRNTHGSHNGPTTDVPPIAPRPATRNMGRGSGHSQTAGGSQASQRGGLLAEMNNELCSLIRDEIRSSLDAMRSSSTAGSQPPPLGPLPPVLQPPPGPAPRG